MGSAGRDGARGTSMRVLNVGGGCDSLTIEDVRAVIREELDKTQWGVVP